MPYGYPYTLPARSRWTYLKTMFGRKVPIATPSVLPGGSIKKKEDIGKKTYIYCLFCKKAIVRRPSNIRHKAICSKQCKMNWINMLVAIRRIRRKKKWAQRCEPLKNNITWSYQRSENTWYPYLQ